MNIHVYLHLCSKLTATENMVLKRHKCYRNQSTLVSVLSRSNFSLLHTAKDIYCQRDLVKTDEK